MLNVIWTLFILRACSMSILHANASFTMIGWYAKYNDNTAYYRSLRVTGEILLFAKHKETIFTLVIDAQLERI